MTVTSLIKIVQHLLLILTVVTPLFFIFGDWFTLGFEKSLLAIAVSSIALILFFVNVIKSKKITLIFSPLIYTFWILILISIISALNKSDWQDSLRGVNFEPYTVGFLALLATLMTLMLVFKRSYHSVIMIFLGLGITSYVLLFYNFLRLFFGSDFLSLGGLFTSIIVSPLGNLNDLAVYAELVLLVSLLLLLKFKTGKLRWLLLLFNVIALVFLMVINLRVAWYFLLFITLVFSVILFLIQRKRKLMTVEKKHSVAVNKRRSKDGYKLNKLAWFNLVLVTVVSVLFVFASGFVAEKINNITHLNYYAIKPTTLATFNIMKSVYERDLLLGSGPNRFIDEWRLYKDDSVNGTTYWNSNFVAASGYTPTLFINLGVLGSVVLLIFYVILFILSYKIIFNRFDLSEHWHQIGIITAVATTFLWSIFIFYVPGAGLLILTAILTGLLVAVSLSGNRQYKQVVVYKVNKGGRLVAGLLLLMLIVFISFANYSLAAQLWAQNKLNTSIYTGKIYSEAETLIPEIYSLYPDDNFLRWLILSKLNRLSQLSILTNPSEEEQQLFKKTYEEALYIAKQAINIDSTEPDNYLALYKIYQKLLSVGVQGAGDRMFETVNKAIALEPKNPIHRFALAEYYMLVKDFTKVKEKIDETLMIKSDFVPALNLLTDLYLSENDLDNALLTMYKLVASEPNNAIFHFRLGLILLSKNNQTEAEKAFSNALLIDPKYADARYMLAQIYWNRNDFKKALSELYIVKKTNPKNVILNKIISDLENGKKPGAEIDYLNDGDNLNLNQLNNDNQFVGQTKGVEDLSDTTLQSINETGVDFKETKKVNIDNGDGS